MKVLVRVSVLLREPTDTLFTIMVKPAAQDHRITWCFKHLNEKLMHEAAQFLLGEQDFSSFRAVECQSHTPFAMSTSFT